MSALQFLNKKSWHTATIKNNEKKWLREQEEAKEKARIDELQKQITEERRQEQLQRLEEESGHVDPSASLKRRRLNWMYEYERVDEENDKIRDAKEREDILLGKKPVNIETVGVTEREQRASLVDMEAKMREDPLVQIEMQKAKLRALAGVSDATTTTKNLPMAQIRRQPKNEQVDNHLTEKAMRKAERQRIREERQVRRAKRALRRQNDRFGVEDSTRDVEKLTQKHATSDDQNFLDSDQSPEQKNDLTDSHHKKYGRQFIRDKERRDSYSFRDDSGAWVRHNSREREVQKHRNLFSRKRHRDWSDDDDQLSKCYDRRKDSRHEQMAEEKRDHGVRKYYGDRGMERYSNPHDSDEPDTLAYGRKLSRWDVRQDKPDRTS